MAEERKPPPRGRADHDRILEAVGIAVLTIDAGGTLLEVNEAAVTMFGHPRAAMLGRNVAMLMPAAHARRHDGYIRHHLETGERRIIGRGRKVEGRRADGSLFPMHLAVGRFESDGEPFFTGIVHDLSENEREHESAARLRSVVEESVNEIYLFAVDTWRFGYANASAMRNVGYDLAALETMTPLDLKPLLDRAAFERLTGPLLRGEVDRVRFQTVHRRRDGSRYDVEVLLYLSDAVAPPEYVAIIQDVTERNRILDTLQHSQRMAAITELSGGVAHDFNNLLTVIGGNLELLEMGLPEAEAGETRELIDEASEAVRVGAGLTARLLGFARRSALEPESLDLNERVLELADLLRRTLGERIALELELAPALWPVRTDPTLVESALMNLAINARDAMGGCGRLGIETANRVLGAETAMRYELAPGDYVTLSVADDGPGIRAEDAERVFEPFYTTKSERGGHGLGLSMVYGFARQSGGHVTVASRPGEGARFTLCLPREDGAAAEPVRDAEPVHSPEDAARRALVLVVEDDARVRRVTVRRLRQLGHDTLEAADGASARELFARRPDIDLLLTDMVMPGALSGLALARALRREVPRLPVIVVSGYSEELLGSGAHAEPHTRVLGKPYPAEALAEALAALLASPPARG